MNALNALSLVAQEAEQGSGVQGIELTVVLGNLQIVPIASLSTRPPSTRSRLGQGWRSRRSSQPLCYRIHTTI